MASTSASLKTISKDLPLNITIGLLIALVVVVGTATWKVAVFSEAMDGLTKGMTLLAERMDDDAQTHVSKSELSNFAELLQAKNPEMDVPIPWK